VRERNPRQCAGVVDQIPCPEVVRAVDDELVVSYQVVDVGLRDTRFVFLDGDVGVEFGHELRGGVDLRPTDIVVAVNYLPLEIRQFDDIVVGDTERADTGGCQILDDRRPESAGSKNEHRRVKQ